MKLHICAEYTFVLFLLDDDICKLSGEIIVEFSKKACKNCNLKIWFGLAIHVPVPMFMKRRFLYVKDPRVRNLDQDRYFMYHL